MSSFSRDSMANRFLFYFKSMTLRHTRHLFFFFLISSASLLALNKSYASLPSLPQLSMIATLASLVLLAVSIHPTILSTHGRHCFHHLPSRSCLNLHCQCVILTYPIDPQPQNLTLFQNLSVAGFTRHGPNKSSFSSDGSTSGVL